MPIEVKCPRCNTVLKVPEQKAGRRGRCPVCGGAVKIPLSETAPTPFVLPPKQPVSKLVWIVVGAGVLLVGLCVVIALSGPRKSRATEESIRPTLTPEQQARLEAQLTEITKLEDTVKKFRDLRVKERRLRARDVLMKIASYAPVTDFEYSLREQVIEEEQATESTPDPGGQSDPWKLNTPLAPAEKDELAQLSDALQTQSADLAKELSAVGVFLTPAKDPLGRALLDGSEVSAKLGARRDAIVKDAFAPPAS